MRLESFEHVQLAMPAGAEAVAVAFYEGLLGIEHVPKPPDLAARGGCWFESGELKVHLGVDSDFRPARKAHPAFVVTGLDALVAKLMAANIAVSDGSRLDGFRRRVDIDDPFGNRIELMERAMSAR